MSSARIELYLGGDLGSWILEQVDPAQIQVVVTADARLADAARSRGHRVSPDAAAPTGSSGGTVVLSVHYPRILPAEVLNRYRAAYNLHPGYLPWGRGYYPAFWALLEGTPAGATLHQMTERLDGGPIVDQIQVGYSDEDTGGSLLQRIREAEKQLFTRYWPRLCSGELPCTKAQEGAGSYHSRAAFFAAKRPEDWKQLDAESLMRRIRCLTSPGYTGLEIVLGSRLVHLTLQDVT